MSRTHRESGWERPSWLYPKNQSELTSVLEMLESVRNVLEDIRSSQMMQCDVAHAIKSIAPEIRSLKRAITKRKRVRR